MNNRITEISIPEPCSQNWDEMEKYNGHKFCEACSKCVIDFSDYSNADIIKILANADGEVCGRLSQTQLNQLNYYLLPMPANRNWMKYLGVLAIGTAIFMQDAKALNLTSPIEISASDNAKIDDSKPVMVDKIYGYVLGLDKKPKAGIRLVINNTKYFATTDKNGRYEILFKNGIDQKNNKLMVESIRYMATIIINFSIEKQYDLVLNKEEPMIVGRIISTKKGNGFL